MILSLIVENIALIDRLHIEFSDGMNVLTGETGAGKSIIVDSMNLVLGERADRELIRSGKEKARVEAVLYVDSTALRELFDAYGIPPEDELIITRELSISGKNVCRINGMAVNLSTLKELMDHVVDLHGQHEHQSLLYAANHISFVDNFGGEPLLELKQTLADAYRELRREEDKLKRLGGSREERARAIDLLEFQVKELTEAQVAPGELDTLKQERDVLMNAQAIAFALRSGYEALYLGDEEGRSALSAIKTVADSIGAFSSYSSEFLEISNRLNESYYALEETARDMGAQAETVVFDEKRQNEVEERIEFISTLKRKYHVSSEEDLIEFLEQAQANLEELIHSDEIYAELTTAIEQRKDALYELSVKLSQKRKQAAKQLETLILKELHDLGMPDARFETRFCDLPPRETADFSPSGIDRLEFYLTTNAGEPMKPLSKTASGGEISRIMLAFKNISAGLDHISTLIFDEIDTGISGHMAHVVAEKMAAIAKSRQVICVTHLPQIAAMGDRNFLIQKISSGNTTNTSVQVLDEEALLAEIARLSGGIDSNNATAYARELLDHAANIKKGISA